MHGGGSWRCRQQVVFVPCSFVDYKVRAGAVNGFTPVKAASAFSVKPLSEAQSSASVISLSELPGDKD